MAASGITGLAGLNKVGLGRLRQFDRRRTNVGYRRFLRVRGTGPGDHDRPAAEIPGHLLCEGVGKAGPPMPQILTRRRLLSAMAVAGIAGLLGIPSLTSGEGPPETNSIRFARNAGICVFPRLFLQATLQAEGFAEIGYVEARAERTLEPLGRGTADFAISFALTQILEIDAGSPITILGGVHVGCYELFARTGINSVPELKDCCRRLAEAHTKDRMLPISPQFRPPLPTALTRKTRGG